MIGQISSTLLVGKFWIRQNLSEWTDSNNCFGIYFFCRWADSVCRTPKHQQTHTFALFYINSVVRNDSMARKKTHTCYVLDWKQSTTETKKRKDISCYMLETVQLNPIKKKDKQLLRAGSGQQQLRARRVHRLWCIPDASKQRARYHALHELLGFPTSFEELVKR